MKMKVPLRLLCILAAIVFLVQPNVPVFAASEGNGYFTNQHDDDGTIDGYLELIPTNYEGASGPINGSVMPNWYGQVTKWSSGEDAGGGAVGTDALKNAFTVASHGTLKTSDETAGNQKNLKQALYDLLYQRNTSGGKNSKGVEWDRMGSALIVHSMLGEKWEDSSRNKSRTISSDDWQKLQDSFVNNDDIVMIRDWVGYRYNTSGYKVVNSALAKQTGGTDENGNKFLYDALRYDHGSSADGKTADAWVIKKKNSTTVYLNLEIICANPLGTIEKLPAPPQRSDYNLKPTVRVDGPPSVEPGGSTTITNAVKNEGVDPSGSTTARLTQIVYQPGAPSSLNGMKVNDDPKEPCDIFPAANRKSCDKVQEKTGLVFQSGAEVSFDTPFIYNVPSNTPVGTRICFTVSVKPPAQDKPNQWRHSALQCIIVAKRPKVQVWGGDVRVGGSINAVANALDGLSYGSWGEYGALSNGQNSGFGTGNGLDGGNANSSQAGWSSLTFANMNTCTFGCYNFTLTSRALGDQFGSGNDRPPSNDLNSWSNGTYAVNGIELGPLTLGRGKSIVIISSGTVTIKGDIAYDDGAPYESIKDIPQLVIRAPKIDIQGNVGRVDAWLIAVATTNGVLNTCSDKAASDDDRLTSNICSNPLTINGPVVADRIYLRRTAGSDNSNASTRGTPAETFNLRADAYLWGNAYANGKGKVRTVYTKELPPRF